MSSEQWGSAPSLPLPSPKYLNMASAEREPITGVWGGAPSGIQGQSPWAPLGAERKLNFDNIINPLILHLSKHFGVSQKCLMTRLCGFDQSRREAKS